MHFKRSIEIHDGIKSILVTARGRLSNGFFFFLFFDSSFDKGPFLAVLLSNNVDGVLIDESDDVRGSTILASREIDDRLIVPLDYAVADSAFDGPGTIFLDDNSFSTEEVLVVLVRPGPPEFALVVEFLVLGVFFFFFLFFYLLFLHLNFGVSDKSPLLTILLSYKVNGVLIDESCDVRAFV